MDPSNLPCQQLHLFSNLISDTNPMCGPNSTIGDRHPKKFNEGVPHFAGEDFLIYSLFTNIISKQHSFTLMKINLKP